MLNHLGRKGDDLRPSATTSSSLGVTAVEIPLVPGRLSLITS